MKKMVMGCIAFAAVFFTASTAAAAETNSESPGSPASQSSSEVGYYKTTCGIIVEGMSSSQFPSMGDFLIYMSGLNAAFCNGDTSLPQYSASPFPTEPSTTPGEG